MARAQLPESYRAAQQRWSGAALLALLVLGCGGSSSTSPEEQPRANTGARDEAPDAAATRAAASGPDASMDAGSGTRECTRSEDCRSPALPVCEPTVRRCVACMADRDCAADERCIEGTCRESCDSDSECRALGLLCDRTLSTCVECVDSNDCSEDRHCRSGVCVADACTPGLSECSADGASLLTCNADGSVLVEQPCGARRCEEEAGVAACRAGACAPAIMLLIDASGSTCADLGGLPRWSAVRESLLAAGDGLVERYGAELPIGAAVFTGTLDVFLTISSTPAIPVFGAACDTVLEPDPEGSECLLLSTVLPVLDNTAAIDAVVPRMQSSGSTPTDRAFAALVEALTAGPEPAANHLVLITDGPPNDTCVGGAGGDGRAQMAALLAAVDDASAAGIVTSVVNLETAVPELQAFLDEVAIRGDPGNAAAQAAAVSTPEQLHAVLEAAFERALACE